MTPLEFLWALLVMWIVTLTGGATIVRYLFKYLTRIEVTLDRIDQHLRRLNKTQKDDATDGSE